MQREKLAKLKAKQDAGKASVSKKKAKKKASR